MLQKKLFKTVEVRSDLATGFYLMKITTEQGEAVHKFVKQ